MRQPFQSWRTSAGKLSFLIILSFAFIGSAQATDYLGSTGVGETWETPTSIPTNWPYQQSASNNCSQASWNGWANEGWPYCSGVDCTNGACQWNSVGITSAAAKNGSRGFRQSNPGNQRESGDIGRDFDIAVTSGNPVWVSFWVRFGTGWSAFNTPTSREPYSHFFFLNSGLSMTGPRVNLLARVPYTGSPQCQASTTGGTPYMFFNFQTDGHDWDQGSYANGPDGNGCWNILDHLGEWHYVQFKFQYNSGSGSPGTGNTAIWIDDTQIYTGTDDWVDGNKGFDYILLSDFFSDRDGSSFTAQIDFDDLRVTDTRPVMPSSSDTTPPAAPTGLGAN